MNTSQRFWGKVRKTAGCWLWTAATNRPGGYGVFGVNYRNSYAHHLAYEQAYGPIPANSAVCHKCDTPCCVKPEHLFLGTQQDNLADMRRKGRQVRGERCSTASLDANKVIQIRTRLAHGATAKGLAREFGVTHPTILRVKTGTTWRHI